jgi:glycosyltransferase involved in cell wall biosynthesis
MRIAFYAPLKSPRHAVPSGDRQMARLLVAALRLCGHTVELASELRSFLREASDEGHASVSVLADGEVERLTSDWHERGAADLWFCYHPYYKSPDLIGPRIAAHFAIPYVTAEASYSGRRNQGVWTTTQETVTEAVRNAALNICFTRRDFEGLQPLAGTDRLAMLPPFLDGNAYPEKTYWSPVPRLVTVAMMRPGDKLESYRMLAGALALCTDLAWTLRIVGDGPCAGEVRALFADFPPGRIDWRGEMRADEVPDMLGGSDILVWPGFGEAYGMAYLEAQAAGLPVVAQAIAGVPEVVSEGRTGLLTPAGDVAAFAEAIARLLGDDALRRTMGAAARRFVVEEHSLERASKTLNSLLEGIAR